MHRMKRQLLYVSTASAIAGLGCSLSVDVNSHQNESSSESGGGGESGAQESRAFEVHNLVSDQADMADHMDSNLVNPWGLAFGPDTFFWVANNKTSTATLYDGDGNIQSDLVGGPIRLPQPPTLMPEADAAEAGGPTGQVFNGFGGFEVAPGISAQFLFATDSGLLLAWSGELDPQKVTIAVDDSAEGASYTGLAIADSGDGAMLYLANFAKGTVDVYDDAFADVELADGAFVDPDLPDHFAPFNVQVIEKYVYVTYAMRDDEGEEVRGQRLGAVTQYGLDGHLVTRIALDGTLDAPWGVAMAPKEFGPFGGALLVGNFGDGRITAYNVTSHRSLGQLMDDMGKPVAIEGLWALAFGNDRMAGDADDLYFTAGPGDETHGVFGEISPVAGQGEDGGHDKGDSHDKGDGGDDNQGGNDY
jgi:uncharacterized protein (TIGR03118 family)